MALSLGRVFGLRVVTISQFVQGSHTMLALHDEQLLHVIRVTNASSSGSAGRSVPQQRREGRAVQMAGVSLG